MQRLLIYGVLLVLFGCAYNPNYDGIHCGEDRVCPEGYICVGPGESGRCLKPGPTDGEDGGDDGGTADDGFDGGEAGDGYGDGDVVDGEDGGDEVTGDDGPVCQPEQEVCDNVDNDCDGLTDAQDDSLEVVLCQDQLGVCAGSERTRAMCNQGTWDDCLVATYQAHSADYQATETSCDGLDNDCDGSTDGMTRDCSVAHQGICAVGQETCTLNVWAGCPLAGTELCDPPGEDENCDGSVDEGCDCVSGQTRDCPLQAGVCAGAQEVCTNSQWPGCDYAAHSADYQAPPEQACDGLDNDCDGTTDGMTRSCGVAHQGICALGTETCVGLDTWEGCPQAQPEECDGADNDCDGDMDTADGDMIVADCEYNTGVCTGTQTHDPAKCVDGGWLPCDHVEYGPDYGAEVCADGLDNDCDGITDCGPVDCEGATRACSNDCLTGTETCQDGVWQNCDAPQTQTENTGNSNCGDNLDNDCDGDSDCAESACDGAQRTCYNQCHPGTQSCQNGSWTSCNAASVEEERERNGNCGDGVDNDCDGNTDGDDPECCGTVGVGGSLLLIGLIPLIRRRRRRR